MSEVKVVEEKPTDVSEMSTAGLMMLGTSLNDLWDEGRQKQFVYDWKESVYNLFGALLSRGIPAVIVAAILASILAQAEEAQAKNEQGDMSHLLEDVR